MKRITAIFLTFFIVFSFLGCGQKDETENNTQQTQKDDEEISKGGSITIYSYKPDTLCPLISKNKANLRMLNIVYDSLFSVDGNMNINPKLAKGYTSSDDNRKYTVELRPDVYFHNGEKLSAGDVVYSVNILKENPENIYFYSVKNVAEVSAAGEYRVEFTLTKPISRFAYLLDFPIIKSSSEELNPETFQPVGTGGFKFENRNEGNLYHLVRFDKWWGGEANLNSIKVKLLPDKDTALYAFSLGELSMCPAENEDWGKFVDDQTSEYLKYGQGSFDFLGFNHKNSLLSQKEIREVIYSVLDRDAILNAGVMGFGESANIPVKKDWGMLEKPEVIKKDTNKARKILEDNLWSIKDGVYQKSQNKKNLSLKFDILINEESNKKVRYATEIANALTDFGVLVNIVKVPFEKYNEMINQKKYDMFIGSIDLSNELDFSLFFGEGNMFGVDDEDLFFAQYNLQLAEDIEDYKLKFGEFEKVFNEKLPFYGIGFCDLILLYNKNIKGELSPTKTDIYNNIESVYLK